MARENFIKRNGARFLVILMLIGVLFSSIFFSVACNNNSSNKDEFPEYTYTETDDGKISNPSFSYGLNKLELTDFPKTSPTGWSKSEDTGADPNSAFSATSGVVKVSEDAWEELLNALYKNNGHKANATGGLTDTEIKESIKKDAEYNPDQDDKYVPSSDDLKKFIIDNYFTYDETNNPDGYKNPGARPGAKDNIVYMLSNYGTREYYEFGTSQKITSSSKIQLNKGEYAKISVWVKTQNLSEDYTDVDCNANVRLATSFNGNTQSDFAITNIVANEWTKYVVYVKADENFDCTLTLSLGLGYGKNGLTKGTVYFDDVDFEQITEEEFTTQTNSQTQENSTEFIYNSENAIKIDAEQFSVNGNATDGYAMSGYVLHDMSFDKYLASSTETANYFKTLTNLDVNENAGFTLDESLQTGNPFGNATPTITTDNTDLPFENATVRKITLNKQSYTFKWSSNLFEVKNQEFVNVNFYVKNKLSKFGSNSITVNVLDLSLDGNKDNDIVNASIASASTVGDDWQKISLVIKNNFISGNDRKFEIHLVIGPADVRTSTQPYEFASGDVYVSSLVLSTGSTVKDEDATATQEKLYDIYNLLTSTASGNVALYAGNISDFNDKETQESYSFSPVASDFGTITHHPTNVKGYHGVVANHFYILEETAGSTLEKDINTRTHGENGNYAGLINTKYINEYEKLPGLENLSDALAFENGDNNVQPIMIYNANANRYGYVGPNNTIASSSRAKVSVTLRVYGGATAYVYLVNVENNSKEVLTLDKFNDNETGAEHSDLALQLKADQNVMGSNEWITLNFYVATGASEKNFRVEIWNGGRRENVSTEPASQGYVFVKDVTITSTDAFNEPLKKANAFSVEDNKNPLYTAGQENIDTLYSFERQLTDLEKKFNDEQVGSKNDISYSSNYVWATNETMVYAIYNTIDPVANDPYANLPEEEDKSEGCTTQTDPSTFWLSFSSILLGVSLVIAIIMLFIKNIRRRRKANKSDAKSHYTITSRIKSKKTNTKVAKETAIEEPTEEDATDYVEEENADTENNEETLEENSEEQLDSYVYGDIEVFGDDSDKE
ncbi:MAG: hypothetical protein E7347_03030 [Clostridiales bacterium]|nr:hypothetical protein [Clostridiales bacterium]